MPELEQIAELAEIEFELDTIEFNGEIGSEKWWDLVDRRKELLITK